ncbi:hypothetical protein C8R44DRAFT_342749 [Mycena epipterygia]|nr:hypothetical protein C8R44DRAFT_342749 [Mycena epipterygia]
MLPAELERSIFEIAAFHDPECMVNLVLVARRVQIWIEPLMYEVLSIHPYGPTERIFRRPLRALHNSMPLYGEHARHVCFRDMYRSDVVAEVLFECTGTRNLAFFNAAFDSPETVLPILEALPLQRLSGVALAHLFPTPAPKDFTDPLCAQITHLGVSDYRDGGLDTWSRIAKMPLLTCLSFHQDGISNSFCKYVLKRCASLEVLVMVCGDYPTLVLRAPGRAELADDPRFVMLVVTDFTQDWETGARGGEDYWVRARALVNKRRSGEMEGYFAEESV